MRTTPCRVAVLFALWAVAGCGADPKPTENDAGPADAGLVSREPADPSRAAIDLFGLPGETSIALTWSRLAEVEGIVEWVIDWGEEGAGYPNTLQAGAAEVSQALLEGLEPGKTYELFISGLTANGAVAPEPGEGGLAPGALLAQSSAIKVTTGPARFGEAREVLAGALDSARVLPFDSRSMAVLFRRDRGLYAAVSDNRGVSFSAGVVLEPIVQNVSAAADSARGIVLACFKTAEGVKVATSTDRGQTFQAQLLAADEGPGCSVAFARGAFLVATEKQAEGKVLVRRSEDGATFSAPVIGAEVTNTGSCDPAIVVDPQPRTVAGAQAEMVYVAWVQKRTTGTLGTDIYLSSSRDGGRSFVSEAGHVVGRIVNDPIVSSETNPTLAVDPANGRLWVAWEDRKATPMVLLAVSEDFLQTAASGSLQWKPGNELGGERVNPSLLVRANGKLLVGFAAGSGARNKLPYVTQFDLAASGGTGGQGKFEAVQPDAAISLKLGSNPLAATAAGTVEVAGPTLSADPLIGEHAIWSTNEAGLQGDLELASSP